MNVVFLDIDGVLVTGFSSSGNSASPECVTALNHITNSTGAKIVVSSTWRWMGMDKVLEHLLQWGVTGEIIGATPTMESRIPNGHIVLDGQPRGIEIQSWLDSNPHSRFVILDDMTDMEHLAPFLINTAFERGLTMKDANEAIRILQERGNEAS